GVEGEPAVPGDDDRRRQHGRAGEAGLCHGPAGEHPGGRGPVDGVGGPQLDQTAVRLPEPFGGQPRGPVHARRPGAVPRPGPPQRAWVWPASHGATSGRTRSPYSRARTQSAGQAGPPTEAPANAPARAATESESPEENAARWTTVTGSSGKSRKQ